MTSGFAMPGSESSAGQVGAQCSVSSDSQGPEQCMRTQHADTKSLWGSPVRDAPDASTDKGCASGGLWFGGEAGLCLFCFLRQHARESRHTHGAGNLRVWQRCVLVPWKTIHPFVRNRRPDEMCTDAWTAWTKRTKQLSDHLHSFYFNWRKMQGQTSAPHLPTGVSFDSTADERKANSQEGKTNAVNKREFC